MQTHQMFQQKYWTNLKLTWILNGKKKVNQAAKRILLYY